MTQTHPALIYAPADFQALRSRITAEGLLAKRPTWFLAQVVVVTSMVLSSWAVVLLTDLWYIQLLNAAFMAFTSVQIAFIVHDSGHRQVFAAGWKNNAIAYTGILFVGASAGWWIEKHNQHHAHPNHEDLDPDVHIPVLAFSEEQALAKRGLFRWVVRHQAVFFFPILALVSVSLRLASIRYLFINPFKRAWLDWIVMVAFPIIYFGLLFSQLTWPVALMFVFVHQALFGLYLGCVFAPNHKGMMLIGRDDKVDFLREQVLTSRNVRAHPFTDFLYGGLNYQIEHHLFPYLPRCNLRRAQEIVKKFCAEKSIPYHETGIVQSYREILASMAEIGRFATPRRRAA